MPTNEQLIGAVNVLANLIRSAYLKRALARIDPDPALNFWRVMHGNLLDMTVIEWCKLFGSDDDEHQQVHWKNVFQDEEGFRDALLQHLSIDHQTWIGYWKQMKQYRDQLAVHLDFDKQNVTHFPILDYAVASSCFYYSQAIAELRGRGVMQYPDNLKIYGDAFLEQAIEIAAKAVTATRGITETVY